MSGYCIMELVIVVAQTFNGSMCLKPGEVTVNGDTMAVIEYRGDAAKDPAKFWALEKAKGGTSALSSADTPYDLSVKIGDVPCYWTGGDPNTFDPKRCPLLKKSHP